MTVKDHRRYCRHPLHYPVKVFKDTRTGRDQVYTTHDISQGGICVHLKKSFERGQTVRVHIPVGDRVFKLRGRIAYCLKDSQSSAWQTGITFSDTSDFFMAKMAEEIIYIQEFQKQMSRRMRREVDEMEAAEAWIGKHARDFSRLFDRAS